jgi:hypothetical protein
MAKNPSLLYWGHRKNTVRAFQELFNFTSYRFQGVKLSTHLKDFPLRREMCQGALLIQGNLRKNFPGFSNCRT